MAQEAVALPSSLAGCSKGSLLSLALLRIERSLLAKEDALKVTHHPG